MNTENHTETKPTRARKPSKKHEAEQIAQAAEADANRPRSVVKPTYKRAYAARALSARLPKGMSRKVAARSSGDWLALTLAKLCIIGKDTFDVDRFEAILDANGVEHRHWNRTTRGWQGRLRMTGRLALQRVVAEAGGELLVPGENGEEIVAAPKSWVQKHTH
jgi:hypothetical protein